jgi:capsular exopolysaccharide synthesis family protein
MRRPTLAEKLDISKSPGLSNYLTGQSGLEELVQNCGIKGDNQSFHVIAAGQNPPNPIELLSSEKMEKAIELLRKDFDYVILDLPPVGEVSDAMAVVNIIDGLLLVVRQNYCNRISLCDAVRQFDFVEAKILGMVFNCTTEHSTGYYKKSYYQKGHYHKGHYRKYSSSYESSNHTSGV